MTINDFNTRVTITTRWRDLDAMNHVNNATFLTYFESVRMHYFDLIGHTDAKDAGNEGTVVVTQTCNYRQQLHHPATLDCGIRCTKIGNSSMTLEYALYLQGTDELVCDGTSASAWIDYDVNKSMRLPDTIRNAIARHEGWETA
jgi:acyl-CoA thioester hydrolase